MTFKDEKIYSGMKALVKKSLVILDRNGFEFKYIEDSNIDVDLKNIPPISFLLNDKISGQIDSKIEETKEFDYTCDLVNKIFTYIYYFKCNKNEILKGLSLSVEHVALGGVLDV